MDARRGGDAPGSAGRRGRGSTTERITLAQNRRDDRNGPLTVIALVVGVAFLAGLVFIAVTIVGAARERGAVEDAAANVPAVGTYDLSGLPEGDLTSTPTEGMQVSANVVLVSEDEVRIGMTWTNTGDAPTSWGCDAATTPSGRWWASSTGLENTWSEQTAALCRTVDDQTVVELDPGESAADFHTFPRDASWGAGPVRLIAVTWDSGDADPAGVEEPPVDLTIDLAAATLEP